MTQMLSRSSGSTADRVLAAAPSHRIDLAAVTSHGIGRGDFVTLIFSGDAAAFGDVLGFYTWNTAQKFVLPDPRQGARHDLAKAASPPLRAWAPDRVEPVDGACFVFGDAEHPAIKQLQSRGGIEGEHFVILETLTRESMVCRRVERLIDSVHGTIAVLGYGDQGQRFAAALVAAGVNQDRVLVFDDDPHRRSLAMHAGFETTDAMDVTLEAAAIVSSPARRPAAFGELLKRASAAGRRVMDQSLPWDERPELSLRDDGMVWLTSAAARATRGENWRLAGRSALLGFAISIIRDDVRQLGATPIRHVFSAGSIPIARETPATSGLDLRTLYADAAATPWISAARVFIGLAGQSNQHDAALAIFAIREVLGELFPQATHAVLPSEHRTALAEGATALERMLFGTTTNRSLGAPYMSPCEQTTIGVLARAFASESPIVEIGSALGGSTLLMAAATQPVGQAASVGPELYSIDPDVPTRPLMHAAFEAYGYAPRLKQVVETSDQAVLKLRHLHEKVGLVFIDGLHIDEVAAADFEAYAPMVRPGGCLAFHDVNARYAGVYRIVAERVAADRRFRPIFMADSLAAFERVT